MSFAKRKSSSSWRQSLSPAKRGARGESLTEQAYRRLEEMIVTLDLAPGAVVSEAELSKKLGIGRTPIGEAVQRLAREDLITILPRRGIVVAEINIKKQLKLLEVRREVERFIARCAARRASPEERRQLLKVAEAMDASLRRDDVLSFVRLDHDLNVLCAAAARNEYAAGFMAMVHSLSRRFWIVHHKQVADLAKGVKSHADLARAIASGDARAAGEASDRLIDYIEEFTRASLTDFL
jgi:DNA-binding GntR family transcriptional regulator